MIKIPLNEKYRPKDFDEVTGVARIKEIQSMIADPMSMPNLLFFGTPGVGKTTVARIIISRLTPVDVLRINGSDTTGVDTIRERVYNFMSGMSSQKDKPKIVWIEEFDFMSQSAFAALRGMIEQFVKNARFICTANYLAKIPEPIQSRFSLIEFEKPTEDEVFARLQHICKEEKITASDEAIRKIIKSARGDMRTSINMIQQLSANGFKTISETSVDDFNTLSKEIYDLIIGGKWSTIRYEIPNKYPDYDILLVELAELFSNSDLPTQTKADIIEIISDTQVDMNFSFDKHICFSACSSRIMKALNK